MIPNATIFFCIVTLFISLILPLIVLLVYALRNRKQGIVSAWIIGALGFFIPQMLIRLPTLALLSPQLTRFAEFSPLLYALTLAVTAGLFELAGRILAARVMGSRLTPKRALAAGLGHGGIEAMVIIGISYINNLVYIVMIQAGTFDALLAQNAANPEVVAQLEQVRTALLTTSPAMFLLAGYERLLTMVCQAAMSVMVCYGMASGKPGKYILLCLGLHTLLDCTAGISLYIGKGLTLATGYCIIYTILTATAILSMVILRTILRRWAEVSKQEVAYDPQA